MIKVKSRVISILDVQIFWSKMRKEHNTQLRIKSVSPAMTIWTCKRVKIIIREEEATNDSIGRVDTIISSNSNTRVLTFKMMFRRLVVSERQIIVQISWIVFRAWRWLPIVLFWLTMIRRICRIWVRSKEMRFRKCRDRYGTYRKFFFIIMLRIVLVPILSVMKLGTNLVSSYFWINSSIS